jgi:hypothetical protein
MKTVEQVTARVEELTVRMDAVRKAYRAASTDDEREVRRDQLLRLEGNVGALEWVLREV